MRAVILAAGGGRELQPLTAKVPAAMVPVLDRPLLAHSAGLLERQGVEEIIAIVRNNARAVTEFFGGRLEYRVESRALGTAGALRLCADVLAGETFVVMSGSVLSDLDVARLVERHRASGAIATLCAARVEDATGLGVVRTDGDGRVLGIEEEAGPGPGLVNAAIYAFEPEILDRLPPSRRVDWALDIFPDLIARGEPLYVHELDDEYWMPVRTPGHLKRAVFDLLEGLVDLPIDGEPLENGLILGEGTRLDGIAMIEPPVWIGDGVHIGEHTRLQGPLVIGHEATIGDGAQLRGSVIMPGSVVPRETVLIGAIAGHARASPFVRG